MFIPGHRSVEVVLPTQPETKYHLFYCGKQLKPPLILVGPPGGAGFVALRGLSSGDELLDEAGRIRWRFDRVD